MYLTDALLVQDHSNKVRNITFESIEINNKKSMYQTIFCVTLFLSVMRLFTYCFDFVHNINLHNINLGT